MIILSWIFCIVMVILQALDYKTTNKILDVGGKEEWWTTKWLMSKIGTGKALLFSKGLVIILFIVMTFLVGNLIIWTIVEAFFCLVYFIVVKRNYKSIK